MNRTSLPQEAIDQIKAEGYRVFMRDRTDSYALFESAEGLGYIQFDPQAGYILTTMHWPNRESGTGYQIARHVSTITPQLLREAVLTVVPHEHRRDKAPRKYAGIDAYRARGSFEAEYQEV